MAVILISAVAVLAFLEMLEALDGETPERLPVCSERPEQPAPNQSHVRARMPAECKTTAWLGRRMRDYATFALRVPQPDGQVH
jgi:hypothetical protein